MKFACKLIEIEGYAMRLMGQRCSLDEPRIARDLAHQRKFGRVVELFERCLCEESGARRVS